MLSEGRAPKFSLNQQYSPLLNWDRYTSRGQIPLCSDWLDYMTMLLLNIVK